MWQVVNLLKMNLRQTASLSSFLGDPSISDPKLIIVLSIVCVNAFFQ